MGITRNGLAAGYDEGTSGEGCVNEEWGQGLVVSERERRNLTSKKEMIRLLRQMGNKKESVEWFKQRNTELRSSLKYISAPSPQLGDVLVRGGSSDNIGRKVISRADVEMEIEINERAIERRLREYAELARIMLDALEENEKKVLWARHAEGLHWDMVAYKVHISRSHCFRIEAVGLEKLCRAWDKHLGKKEEKKGRSV